MLVKYAQIMFPVVGGLVVDDSTENILLVVPYDFL